MIQRIAFHLRGLRQILKIKTTFVDRSQTNKVVLAKANRELRRRPKGKEKGNKPNKLVLMGESLRKNAETTLGHFIREPEEEPTRQATFKGKSLKPNLPKSRRVGRPRNKWTIDTMARIWNKLRKRDGKPFKKFNVAIRSHRLFIQHAAMSRRF